MTHFTENAPSDQTQGAADLTPKAEEALRFLELLGKDPESTFFRAFARRDNGANWRRGGADLKGFDFDALKRDNITSGIYAVIGEADKATGPSGGVRNSDVKAIPALFVEWDDKPIEWQENAWKEFNLPQPSFQAPTGGKSIHSYWVLHEAVSPEQWKEAQQRLIALCGSDHQLDNPSRVMRMPGFTYFDKAKGQTTGTTRLINITETRYSLEEVLANVPELPLGGILKKGKKPPAQPGSQRAAVPDPAVVGLQVPLVEFVSKEHRLLLERGSQPGSNNDEQLQLTLDLAGAEMWLQERGAEPCPSAAELFDCYLAKCEALWQKEGNDPGGYDRRKALDRLQRAYEREPKPSTPEEKLRQRLEFHRSQAQPESEKDHALAREAALSHIANAATTVDLKYVLHPWLAERLIRRAESFPIHPLALLAPGLATCAALVGTRARVEVKDGWTEPLVIWAGNVADASSLKSSDSNVWSSPLVNIEKEERRAAKSFNESLSAEDKETHRREPRRFMSVDATYESISCMAADPTNFGLISYQDELSSWFANLERQCSTTARAGWLSLWGGSAIMVDRKTTDSVFATKSAVSLFGNVQPDRLAAMMAKTGDGCESAGDGLWSRFLWVRPPHVPFVYVDKNEEISRDIHRLLEKVNQTPISINPDETSVFQLTKEAKELMSPWWAAWAKEEADSPPARKAFLGKMRGYSVRLAGLLAVIDTACNGLEQQLAMSAFFKSDGLLGRWVLPVTAGHAERALMLSLFFLAQFDALQNSLGHGDVPPNVAKLLACVERTDVKPVPLRLIGKWKLPNRDAPVAAIKKWLDTEVVGKYGLGRVVQGARRDSWAWAPPEA